MATITVTGTAFSGVGIPSFNLLRPGTVVFESVARRDFERSDGTILRYLGVFTYDEDGFLESEDIRKIEIISADGQSKIEITDFNNIFELYSTPNDDTFNGSEARDVFYGGGGNDTLKGNEGNDALVPGSGSDTVDGGDGYDTYVIEFEDAFVNITRENFSTSFISSDPNITSDALARVPQLSTVSSLAADTAIQGSDTDSIQNIEAVIGGTGNDVLVTADYAEGGGGNDAIFVAESSDPDEKFFGRLEGGPGDDLLVGGEFSDTLRGDAGDDFLVGRGGSDTLIGGEGDDTAIGGDGEDSFSLFAGLFSDSDNGNDILIGGGDVDSVIGPIGAPNDVNYFNLSERDFSISSVISKVQKDTGFDLSSLLSFSRTTIEANSFQREGWNSKTSLDSIEQAYGQGSREVMIGSAEDAFLSSSGGNDVLIASGNDTAMSAGDGSDVLVGGDGNDYLDGAFGADYLFGGAGDDVLLGDGLREPSFFDQDLPGADVMYGGAGSDFFNGRGGNNIIVGGESLGLGDKQKDNDTDIAFFAGSRDDYDIQYRETTDDWVIKSISNNVEEETTVVSEVEYLIFNQRFVPSMSSARQKIANAAKGETPDPDVVPLIQHLFLDFETNIPIKFSVVSDPTSLVGFNSRTFVDVDPTKTSPLANFDGNKDKLVEEVQAIFDRSGVEMFVTRHQPVTVSSKDIHTVLFSSEKLTYDVDGDPADMTSIPANGSMGDDGRWTGTAHSGVDTHNHKNNGGEGKEDQLFVFMDNADISKRDADGVLIDIKYIAEATAHEAAHGMGATHINDFGAKNTPEIMDYSFGAVSPKLSDEVRLVGLDFETHVKREFKTINNTYHLRRYTVGEDAQALRDIGLVPGDYDFSFGDFFQRIILENLPTGVYKVLYGGDSFAFDGESTWIGQQAIQTQNGSLSFEGQIGEEYRIIGLNDSGEPKTFVRFTDEEGLDGFVWTVGQDVPQTVSVQEYDGTLQALRTVAVATTRIETRDLEGDGPPTTGTPIAADDTAETDEDTSVTFNILDNDSDPDGDPILLNQVFDTDGSLIPFDVETALTGGGTITISRDGTTVFDPAGDFEALGFNPQPEPPAATFDLVYNVVESTDEGLVSDTATVTIDVRGLNDAPVADDFDAETTEDVSVILPVLDMVSDVDGDELELVFQIDPAIGEIFFDGEDYRFTPAPDVNGDFDIEYIVTDENDSSTTGTLSLTVEPLNDDPVAADDTATTNQNTFVAIDFLANDSDPDGDSLTVTSVGPASNGLSSLAGYEPDPGFFGTDSFTYTISDRNGGTATATAKVTVSQTVFPNQDPVAVDDTATTNQNTFVAIDFLANDSDPDGDGLTVTSVGPAANGLSSLAGYEPDPGFFGIDSFTYTILDGNGGTATATATVTVTNASEVADYSQNNGGTYTRLDRGWSTALENKALGWIPLTQGIAADTVPHDDLVNIKDIIGSDFRDLIVGDNGSNIIRAGNGNDYFGGLGGDDTLFGEEGNDRLFGQMGNDTLDGGVGNDMLTGGEGLDIFIYNGGQDEILDFDPHLGDDDSGSDGDLVSISIAGIADFDDLLATASQDGSDTVFNISDADRLTLQNTLLVTLEVDDFKFV